MLTKEKKKKEKNKKKNIYIKKNKIRKLKNKKYIYQNLVKNVVEKVNHKISCNYFKQSIANQRYNFIIEYFFLEYFNISVG